MSITFFKFGKIGSGNLGNNCFELAACLAFSKRYNTQVKLPNWKYESYFPNLVDIFDDHILGTDSFNFQESYFHYDIESLDKYKQILSSDHFVNLNGWFQSSKYFEEYSDYIKTKFQFSKELKDKCISFLKKDKKTIAISVRRGDYVGNPNYELLPVSFYLQALYKHFPDYENYNILIFSDDIEYCKIHFSGLPNVWFAENMDAIHQLCLMSSCDHFIIANSTFSWWGAWLGEKEHSKIIRANYHLAGKLLQNNDWKDYYPERWLVYDHKDIHKNIKKYDLKDVTFTVPVSFDSKDRKQNLDLNICMLQKSYDTNIIIGEQGTDSFKYFEQWCSYRKFDFEDFHRTKMLNLMCKDSNTEIVVNWDADVFVSESQIMRAVHLIRSGKAEIVYPYDGKFARVPRNYFSILESNLDLGETFKAIEFKGALRDSKPSTGGAIFYDKDSFMDAGMENEYMISYAPEDTERFHRFNTLGLKVERVNGQLFHIDHQLTYNSSVKHKHFASNNAEFYDKILLMDKETLQEYVNSWPWLEEYNTTYYETIGEGAIKSRNEIFKTLNIKVKSETNKSFRKVDSILDVGCGIGEWGYEIEKFGIKEYIGLDFRIPKKSLLIKKENFISHNLKHAFDLKRKFDLVMCFEVAEHLKEKYADQLVSSIVKHGDTILFSAAIPYQGGVNHYNEQWQSYWANKFLKHGYYCDFTIRKKIVDNENIELWYRQNIMMFRKTTDNTIKIGDGLLDYVHPEMYIRVINSLKNV